MLIQIHPQLGEKAKGDIIARYGAFTGKWRLYTQIDLKGRGINLEADAVLINQKKGTKLYYATKKAFNSLCSKFTIVQEIDFD